MKRKQRVIFVLLVMILSFMGCNKQKESEDRTKAQAEFEALVKDVNENFIYDGFKEILKDKSVELLLPLEYEKIDETAAYFQKLFVYKNEDKGVIIILQITESQSPENSWNHGMSYGPDEYTGYDEGSDADMPEVEMGAYSFTYDGYNYMSIGLCESDPEDAFLAKSELIAFNNALIDFITQNMEE